MLNSIALLMAPFIPSLPGVNTSSTPRALSKFTLSILMVSGIVNINLYPFAAAIKERAIPVFPLVGSIITELSFNNPFSSASLIIANPILSLTLPAGLKYSSFAIIVPSKLFSDL